VRADRKGIGNDLISGKATIGTGPVDCRERLGGLLNIYQRVA